MADGALRVELHALIREGSALLDLALRLLDLAVELGADLVELRRMSFVLRSNVRSERWKPSSRSSGSWAKYEATVAAKNTRALRANSAYAIWLPSAETCPLPEN